MAYEPETPPVGVPTVLGTYLSREFRRISDAFVVVDNVKLRELHNEPDKPRDGMVVLADGTNWDPGSGAGFYGRSAGAWVLLG